MPIGSGTTGIGMCIQLIPCDMTRSSLMLGWVQVLSLAYVPLGYDSNSQVIGVILQDMTATQLT